MTARKLIKLLLNKPLDAEVVFSNGENDEGAPHLVPVGGAHVAHGRDLTCNDNQQALGLADNDKVIVLTEEAQ